MPQTYNFPNFILSEEYPESSQRLQFGKSWEFVSKPQAPDQIIFNLKYAAMVWYLTAGVPNTTTNPTYNMRKLIEFYEAHRLYEKFDFPHPWRGTVTCRFAVPLVVPAGIPGGNGVTEPFEVKLRLQP